MRRVALTKVGSRNAVKSGSNAVRRPQSGGDTRTYFKQVAAEMFAARGYHATTLRELAAKTGMTLGTLYHYFPSKSELLLELMDDAMVPLVAQIPRVKATASTDPAATLAWMVEAFLLGTLERLSTATISETELRALSGPDLSRAVKKRDAYQRVMELVIAEGVRQKVFEVQDSKLTVFAILSMCSGVPRWYRPDGRSSPQTIAKSYSALALRMVGYRSAKAVSNRV